MSARAGFVVAVSVASALLLVVATGGAQDVDPGERMMNAACQDCHGLRVIQTAAMDLEGWTKQITLEIERGAKLPKENVATLATYLTRTHGPVPEGNGKEILLHTCTMCHDLMRIRFGRRTPEEWEETLVSMLNEGAQLSDEDFARVHRYLAINFGVE
jgi:cytochrome c5